MPLALSLHTSTLPAPPLKPQRLRRSPTPPSCTPGLRKGSGGRYGNGLSFTGAPLMDVLRALIRPSIVCFVHVLLSCNSRQPYAVSRT